MDHLSGKILPLVDIAIQVLNIVRNLA